MSDAHSDMLDLAVRLARREAAGHTLARPERVLSDIMWVGTQVSPNGLDGWLAYTSCERMRRTLTALREVGAPDVAVLLEQALALAEVDPETMTDAQREAQVDRLEDADREELAALDSRLLDAYEPAMELFRYYAQQQGLGPPWE